MNKECRQLFENDRLFLEYLIKREVERLKEKR